MQLKEIYLLIADISGYTNFVSEHKFSLLHAEKIIGNLLEAVIDQSKVPLTTHELLGDAVTMYAVVDGSADQTNTIYRQMVAMRQAFQEMESKHISECNRCSCDACQAVDQLKLKVILHRGEAAFTEVAGIQKISGEPIIHTHRLLKNDIDSRDYFLITPEIYSNLDPQIRQSFTETTEHLEGLGENVVYYHSFDPMPPPGKPSLINKVLRAIEFDIYSLKRKFGKPQPNFNHPPQRK